MLVDALHQPDTAMSGMAAARDLMAARVLVAARDGGVVWTIGMLTYQDAPTGTMPIWVWILIWFTLYPLIGIAGSLSWLGLVGLHRPA